MTVDEEKRNNDNLKIEAARLASVVHSTHVGAGDKILKPQDVVALAKKIHKFLKGTDNGEG